MNASLNSINAFSGTLSLVVQNAIRAGYATQESTASLEAQVMDSLQHLSDNFKHLKSVFGDNLAESNANYNVLMQTALNFTLVHLDVKTKDNQFYKELVPELFQGNTMIKDPPVLSREVQVMWLYSDLLDIITKYQLPQNPSLYSRLSEIQKNLDFYCEEILNQAQASQSGIEYAVLYQSLHQSFINIFKPELLQKLTGIGGSGAGDIGLKLDLKPEQLTVESNAELESPTPEGELPEVDDYSDIASDNNEADIPADEIPEEASFQEEYEAAFHSTANGALSALEASMVLTKNLVDVGVSYDR